MANKESLQKSGYIVDVKVVDVEKRYKDGPKHYVYVLQVTWANPSNLFIIYRRYAQFFDLQCQLLDLFAEAPLEPNESTQPRQIPCLPGKIILGRSQIRQIALERKQGLNEYCQSLISLPERISRSRPILDFFHPTATDVQKSLDAIVEEKKPIDKSSVVISGPAKLETYRCLSDFKATEKVELSVKRNDIVQVLQKHPNGWWFVQFNDQTGFVPGAYLEPSDLKRGAREGKVIEKALNETYIVTQTFTGTGKDELSLEQGSFVTVTEKSLTGWWKVKFNNLTGQFPAIYLTSADGRYTPGSILDDTSSNSSKRKPPVNQNDSDDDVEDDYHLDPSKVKQTELYYAHKDYTDRTGDCLSFKRGDIIEIHDKRTNGWWLGRKMKGEPILSRVPANYLQQEPVTTTTTSNQKSNTQTFVSKFRSKTPEQSPDHSASSHLKEKSATLRKNFESATTTTTTVNTSSNSIKKPPSNDSTTAPRSFAAANSTLFRPVNDKPTSTTASNPQKSSPIVTPSPFRPVVTKQETTVTTKTSSVATPPSSTNTSKISSVTIPSAFRSVGSKQETPTPSQTSSSHSISSAFRPNNSKQETVTSAKSTSGTGSAPFRPLNNKPETNTKATTTSNRLTNEKPSGTQSSVKNLTSKFNQK